MIQDMREIGNLLDTTQYTRDSIHKYEKIYGRNFVSPGGLNSTREIVKLLNLAPGMKVLDVGSGLGGAAFYMAQEYSVYVHGLDVSNNMVMLAQERLKELQLETLVAFEHGDILKTEFEVEFDVVYSRDTFLHIHEKPHLFQTLKRALKSDGLLFFTDYCKGEGKLSEDFLAYVRERGYDLHTPQGYGKLLEQAGFTQVQVLDKTTLFGDYLRQELTHLSDQNAPDIQKSWNEKIIRNQRGEQGWGWFMARKPKET